MKDEKCQDCVLFGEVEHGKTVCPACTYFGSNPKDCICVRAPEGGKVCEKKPVAFVVTRTLSHYDDSYSVPVRIFMTKEAADSFCRMENRQADRISGMESAVSGMMYEWDNSHLQDAKEYLDQHYADRLAHYQKLEEASGLKAARNRLLSDLEHPDRWSEYHISFHVHETPFGKEM